MTFRFGLIGAGMVAGAFHRAAAASDTVAIAGVYARRQAARDTVAAEQGCKTYDSLDALIADAPDAVIATTPPNARAQIVAACAAAGVPLLTEKPLERDSASAEILIAQMGDVPFGVVLQHRMRPASQAARRLIADGVVGAVRMLRVDVPWWRDPGYYAAPGRGTFARDGGGVMLTQAIHALDLGLWLAGDAVASVQGQTSRAVHDLEAEDTAVAGMTFAGGATGVFTATTAAFPGHPETIEVTCDAATLRLASGQLTVLHRDGRVDHVGEKGGTGSGADPMAFPHDWHQAVMEDFASAVRQGRPPAIPAQAAMAVHRTIDAIARSARDGTRVTLPAPTDPQAGT
ncbi:Gfo/Idh/MocA family protein [Jannaschia sp. M317]|uniref:Gfo/Idh/MocA family protein n=1 Tax=Jannaschia sp. M317 TaxID=2867011 RepID=UPI0021A38216|nr:Gfo/Idh/MocA family oxidoreductase [Jannaschia sp. M317]UWQ16191.1 Gfo/Idh/MocA family oxidoreductase [Jannaschia sp. M317]